MIVWLFDTCVNMFLMTMEVVELNKKGLNEALLCSTLKGEVAYFVVALP